MFCIVTFINTSLDEKLVTLYVPVAVNGEFNGVRKLYRMSKLVGPVTVKLSAAA